MHCRARSVPSQEFWALFLFIFLVLFGVLRLLSKKLFAIYNQSINSSHVMHVSNLQRIFFLTCFAPIRQIITGLQVTYSHILESNPNSMIIFTLDPALIILLQVIIVSEPDHQQKKITLGLMLQQWNATIWIIQNYCHNIPISNCFALSVIFLNSCKAARLGPPEEWDKFYQV